MDSIRPSPDVDHPLLCFVAFDRQERSRSTVQCASAVQRAEEARAPVCDRSLHRERQRVHLN